jgi:hypothetical protein
VPASTRRTRARSSASPITSHSALTVQ